LVLPRFYKIPKAEFRFIVFACLDFMIVFRLFSGKKNFLDFLIFRAIPYRKNTAKKRKKFLHFGPKSPIKPSFSGSAFKGLSK
jgi:hypothetical protein